MSTIAVRVEVPLLNTCFMSSDQFTYVWRVQHPWKQICSIKWNKSFESLQLGETTLSTSNMSSVQRSLCSTLINSDTCWDSVPSFISVQLSVDHFSNENNMRTTKQIQIVSRMCCLRQRSFISNIFMSIAITMIRFSFNADL